MEHWMHPYEKLSLFSTGLVLSAWLIGFHVWMLLQPDELKRFLVAFPRNHGLGQVMMGLGFAWFWLLVAPSGWGLLSSLSMNLGDFPGAKPILRMFVPIGLVLVVVSVRDFLAVRALGVLGLLAAAPLLEAAFLKDPITRLLVPIYAYVMLTASLFWVGMPYLFRDVVTWVVADDRRWKLCAWSGLAYGLATLVCALSFWRGY